MEKFTLRSDAFDRPGGMELAISLIRQHKDSLKTLSITLREPRQLGYAATYVLLQNLKEITALQKLGLGNFDLTGRSLGILLAEILGSPKWSQSLQELRISCCLVDQEFVEQARRGVGVLENLKVLVFHCNIWTESLYGRLLGNLRDPVALTELCLSSNGLTQSSLVMLATAFRRQHRQTMNCLNLSGNDLFGGGYASYRPFFEALTLLQKLESLYLHQCGIDSLCVKTLFRTIESMPNLARLMMHDNNFDLGEAWTRSLPNISGLSHLWIGRQHLFPLQQSSRVVSYMEAMSEGFRRNTSLVHLDVSGYPRSLHEHIQGCLARNVLIQKSKVFLLDKTLPIAVLPHFLVRLFYELPRIVSLGGEITPLHLVLRGTLERWIHFSLSKSAHAVITHITVALDNLWRV